MINFVRTLQNRKYETDPYKIDIRGVDESITLYWNSRHRVKQNLVGASRLQTCQELAQHHKETPCKTVTFEERERDGWESENFAPT